VFWAVLEGLVAIALLVMITGSEGLAALQTAAIIAALPFSLVMIAMCVSIWKQFRQERAEWLRAERKHRARELTDAVTQNMINEGLITPNGGDQDRAPARTVGRPDG
jgi:choline/glycine/proline betaine transport protein